MVNAKPLRLPKSSIQILPGEVYCLGRQSQENLTEYILNVINKNSGDVPDSERSKALICLVGFTLLPLRNLLYDGLLSPNDRSVTISANEIMTSELLELLYQKLVHSRPIYIILAGLDHITFKDDYRFSDTDFEVFISNIRKLACEFKLPILLIGEAKHLTKFKDVSSFTFHRGLSEG